MTGRIRNAAKRAKFEHELERMVAVPAVKAGGDGSPEVTGPQSPPADEARAMDVLCGAALEAYRKSKECLADLSDAQKFNVICAYQKDRLGQTPAPIRDQLLKAIPKRDSHLGEGKSGMNRVKMGIRRGRELLEKL